MRVDNVHLKLLLTFSETQNDLQDVVSDLRTCFKRIKMRKKDLYEHNYNCSFMFRIQLTLNKVSSILIEGETYYPTKFFTELRKFLRIRSEIVVFDQISNQYFSEKIYDWHENRVLLSEDKIIELMTMKKDICLFIESKTFKSFEHWLEKDFVPAGVLGDTWGIFTLYLKFILSGKVYYGVSLRMNDSRTEDEKFNTVAEYLTDNKIEFFRYTEGTFHSFGRRLAKNVLDVERFEYVRHYTGGAVQHSDQPDSAMS